MLIVAAGVGTGTAMAGLGLLMIISCWLPPWLRGRTRPRLHGLAVLMIGAALTSLLCAVEHVGPTQLLFGLTIVLWLAALATMTAAGRRLPEPPGGGHEAGER